jgi:hypothetical protein
MSGVFCEYHRRKYHGKYSVSWKDPVQSPNNAICCCRDGCSNLGMVGLSLDEDAEYERGERIFTCGYFVRIQVQ